MLIERSALIVLFAVVVAACGPGSDTNSADTSSSAAGAGVEPKVAVGGGSVADDAPSGELNTARPEFRWPSVEEAEQYRIVVRDAGGNGYERVLDAVDANCQASDGSCGAATSLEYFDNDLTWFVESTVDGVAGPTSGALSITTPVSPHMQPIKSNTGICEGWASIAYDKYVALNNTWNSKSLTSEDWSQIMHVTENADGSVQSSWTYDWLGRNDAGKGGQYEVKAYPQVFYGPKLGTHVSGSKEETGLPELVRDLPEFKVAYDFTEADTRAERNVALESFFHDSCRIQGPCDDVDNRAYEMMIWVSNPERRTPGDLALTGVLIDNKKWNVYIKPRSNKQYIAFTAQSPSTSGVLDWKSFVDWTVQWTADRGEALGINKLEPDYCMGAIEMGAEIWWGRGTFTINRFEVTR
jgi:hypothetical protein